MRRIISSYLPIGLMLLLLLAVPAGAQNVTIELTPITYPIVLPDSGGSFDYLLTVTNQGSMPITATVWCMATLPRGSLWGPVLRPVTQTLGGGQTQSTRRTQTVPPRAPYGYFTLHAYVGIYPDTIWAQDQFEFQRQGVSGTEQEWVARYNGPGNDADGANSLALDAARNIYVTGFSWAGGSFTTSDFATVKYDASGNQLWVARYNGPGNGADGANSLAVDGGGNVFVTGASWGIGTSEDYATIKYDASGNELWVAHWNGTGNGQDQPREIAIAPDASIYVTGTGFSTGTGSDYTTIKYDLWGGLLWVAQYDGPAHNTDEAKAIAVDQYGNSYVTGESFTNLNLWFACATVKYDPMGNQLWAGRYEGHANGGDEVGRDIAVDDNGNVYVTGQGSGLQVATTDYITIKYDSNGNCAWVERFEEGGYEHINIAQTICIDLQYNVYVTGSCKAAGTTLNDYVTIKYDSCGNQQWISRFHGPGYQIDGIPKLKVDEACNVYIAGVSFGNGPFNGYYATIKYDSSGQQQWVSYYNGSGNGYDQANFVDADGSGNVYVTGLSSGLRSDYDYATIKYSGGNIANWMPVEATVLGQPLPQEFALHQNYPNPFNATTVLSYQLPVASHVKLEIFDIAGRLVGAHGVRPSGSGTTPTTTLIDGWRSAGTHELTFDASGLPSGVYIYRLTAGEFSASGKMVLMK